MVIANRRILPLTLFAVVACLTGCASTQTIAPAPDPSIPHYRSLERYDHVVLDIRPDPDNDSARLEGIAIAVAAELAAYLESHGIQTSLPQDDHPDTDAYLSAIISQTHPAERYQLWKYYIALRLADMKDNTIDSASVFHNAGLSKHRAITQQLAALIADDMLLIWHTGAASQLRNHRAEMGESAGAGDITRFAWDPFPPQHIAAHKITDVTYEFRLTPQGVSFSDVGQAVFRIDGLIDPEFELPFSLPLCGKARWAVRAHFTLDGHTRVTEWSGKTYQRRYSSAAALRPSDRRGMLDHFLNNGELISRDPDNGLTCRDIGAGEWTSFWSTTFTNEKESGSSPSTLKLSSLQPGQSIATFAAPGQQCDSDDCYQRENDRLVTCIRRDFSHRNISIPVRDFSETLNFLPENTGVQPETLVTDDLLALIQIPANRARLLNNGIVYLIAATVPSTTTRRVSEPFGGLDEGIVAAGVSVDNLITSSININVIDVAASTIIGSLESAASKKRGWSFGFVNAIPIVLPHGYLTDTEAKACEDISSKLSFALALGNTETEWHLENFENVHDPMW